VKVQDRVAAVERLRALLGADAVAVEPSDCAAYERGWRYGAGTALCVAKPSSAAQVAQVLALAHGLGLRVQPIGANTGLVGASNPDASGEMVVLSLERLNRALELDRTDRVVVADAGVTLSQLEAAAEPLGLTLAIDLGADPQLGGMVATNTGGTRLLRYGDVRKRLLGLEVALPDGQLVSRLRRLRKDNTGFDWKQLFVGTSGTFGVITKVAFELLPRPRTRAAALACVEDGAAALELLTALEAQAGEVLSAFEVLSREAIEGVLLHGNLERSPFPAGVPGYAVLVELSSALPPEVLDLEGLLGSVLEGHLESGAAGLTDVLLGQAEDFWRLRHQVSECLAREGKVLALDLSVPRSRLAAFTHVVRERLRARHPFVRVCDFGHWGDGGTHLNLVWREGEGPADGARFSRELQAEIYRWCVGEFEGSYSAEHGVGPHNLAAYREHTPPELRRVCGLLKEHFDPQRRLSTVALD
jgi:FAD/FMN-containing dehydrogenase